MTGKSHFKGKNYYLIAVDIGNTSIHLAVLRGARLIAAEVISSGLKHNDIKKRILSIYRVWLKRYPQINGIMICSVVPALTRKVKTFSQTGCSKTIPVVVIGKDIVPPIKNRYAIPAQVGQDRLVVAFAAKWIYQPPLVVIDLGTATTFDVVSKNGDYLGGLIVPGIELSVKALARNTALLPQVNIRKPKKLIANNTEESILGGLYYGHAEMIKGITRQLKRRISPRTKVILTGGYVGLFKPCLRQNVDYVDHNLIFKGMSLLWKLICTAGFLKDR